MQTGRVGAILRNGGKRVCRPQGVIKFSVTVKSTVICEEGERETEMYQAGKTKMKALEVCSLDFGKGVESM